MSPTATSAVIVITAALLASCARPAATQPQPEWRMGDEAFRFRAVYGLGVLHGMATAQYGELRRRWIDARPEQRVAIEEAIKANRLLLDISMVFWLDGQSPETAPDVMVRLLPYAKAAKDRFGWSIGADALHRSAPETLHWEAVYSLLAEIETAALTDFERRLVLMGAIAPVTQRIRWGLICLVEGEPPRK